MPVKDDIPPAKTKHMIGYKMFPCIVYGEWETLKVSELDYFAVFANVTTPKQPNFQHAQTHQYTMPTQVARTPSHIYLYIQHSYKHTHCCGISITEEKQPNQPQAPNQHHSTVTQPTPSQLSPTHTITAVTPSPHQQEH